MLHHSVTLYVCLYSYLLFITTSFYIILFSFYISFLHYLGTSHIIISLHVAYVAYVTNKALEIDESYKYLFDCTHSLCRLINKNISQSRVHIIFSPLKEFVDSIRNEWWIGSGMKKRKMVEMTINLNGCININLWHRFILCIHHYFILFCVYWSLWQPRFGFISVLPPQML